MPEYRFYHVDRTGKLNLQAALPDALAASKKDGYVWLDFCDPAREDLEPLIELMGLHPLSVEDCLDDNQIPKI
jgi:magnesium transporter